MMTASDRSTIKSACEAASYNSITTYTDNYESYMYSWRTCNHYTYDMSPTCSINHLYFSAWCSGLYTSSTYSYTYGNSWGCGSSLTNECYTHLANINSEKPWYDSYVVSGCPDYELK